MPCSDHGQLYCETFLQPRHALELVRPWVSAALAERTAWTALEGNKRFWGSRIWVRLVCWRAELR